MARPKNLINSLENAVFETLSGLSYMYPQLEHHVSHGVVLSPDCRERRDKVALVCGGGSGHEPFAAGFVGTGMLTASVAGSIFAAPPSSHITYALRRVAENNDAGVLVLIPNYTGDRLNFGIAIEKARQADVAVEDVIIGDDCSIPDCEGSIAGKRGLVGLLFVIKIAGALAEKGLPLHDVAETARRVSQSIATYGIGLTACAIPGVLCHYARYNYDIMHTCYYSGQALLSTIVSPSDRSSESRQCRFRSHCCLATFRNI